MTASMSKHQITKQRQVANAKRRVLERQQLYQWVLHRECQECGSRKNPSLHHCFGAPKLNSKGKRARCVGAYVYRSDSQLIEEIVKTVPLCRECHNRAEKGEITYFWPVFHRVALENRLYHIRKENYNRIDRT